jgi:hypothetical protein
MKLSTALILSVVVGGASAFAPSTSATSHSTTLRMSSSPEENMMPEQPAAAIRKEPEMSISMPFMTRPMALDGSMAGDVGFDPLGFAKDSASLMNYREAEIRHARLAMLAAAGWPLSELFNGKISSVLGMNSLLDSSDRAPSVLNGGLDKVSLVYWGACILGTAAIEAYGISKSKTNAPDYFPGNLGFDPLGMYPKDKEGQMRMQLQEIKNGRLAMIAITAFAVQEFVSKLGVVDETPLFFKPITTVLHELTNSGYIYH